MATTPKKAKKKKKRTAKKGNGKVTAKVAKPIDIEFHYIKGPDFRIIHVDGAIGGLTTSGFLHIAFYCERAPIPTKITQKVNPDGTLGDVVEKVGKQGVVRQMENDIIVNEDTAKRIKVWLDGKLEEFESRRKVAAALKKSI